MSYPVLYSFQTINSFTTYNSPGTYTAPATKTPKYLFILAYGGGSSPNQVLIKSVTITETPPTSFSLAASSTSIPCGNTQPITFTITGTGVPQGASLSYNFNIGTGNNGWLYNGAAAPSNIITSANSISLTPVCGSSLSNISATVSLNGTNYTTNSVKVSILQPNLSINGVTSFCNGSNNYFINNLPCNATVNWSASPFGIANLTTNGNIATLTQTGNGDVFLQAAVNNVCGQNYPSITQTIHIGTPSPPTITNLNYDNTCGTFAEAYCDIPANTTGFIWNFNYGQVIQNNPGTSGNYFLLKPLGQNKVGFTYYDYLSVQATNNCGVSAASATSSFTIGPIASSCGSGGGGKGFLSTGPVIGQPLTENLTTIHNNVRMFPNPVRATLTIQLPDSIHLSNSFITITNLDGRRIHTLHPNTLSPVITTTHWAAGIYIITIYEGTKKIAVQQVLKY